MERHILTLNSLIHAQVCSEGDYTQALEWIRINNPAGTHNNWMKNEKGEYAPVKCEKYPERTHYMFIC